MSDDETPISVPVVTPAVTPIDVLPARETITMSLSTPKPSPGRVVRYVLPVEHRSAKQSRPAEIVRNWNDEGASYAPEDEVCNLSVTLDGVNDLPALNLLPTWFPAPTHMTVYSVRHDETKTPGTWHWPPR